MKVLVGTVTNQCKDYCWDKFHNQLKGLQLQGHDVVIIDNSIRLQPRGKFKTIHYKKYKQILSKCTMINANLPNESKINGLMEITKDCMNLLRDYFLKGDYTHLFILESDVFIEKDTLQRLIDMDSDVANFTYLMNLKRFNEYSLCVQSMDVEKQDRTEMLTPEDGRQLINTGIKQLGKDILNGKVLTQCGYGCTLVKREVLEQVEFRTKVLEKDKESYPDSSFHLDVLEKGFTNLLNTDWLPQHENLHNQTMDMIKIINVQNQMSRRERRAKR